MPTTDLQPSAVASSSPPSQPEPAPSSRFRRHLAVVLVFLGLVAAAPGVATLAGFTARDVNKDNVISTGALDIAFGQATRYVSVANMKPGDWLDQTVDITNSGTLAADYVVDAINLRVRQGSDLDEVLRVSISRKGEVLAEGVRLSALDGVTGRLEPKATDLLDIRISWPENAPEIDNRFEGAVLDFDFVVRAAQLSTSTTVPATTVPATTVPATTVPATTAAPAAGLFINGVPGLTAIEVPFDPKAPGITVVNANSTRFSVANTTSKPAVFRFESSGTTEVWDGSAEWIETIVSADWGWDGYTVELAPGEKREFIANSWDSTTKLSVIQQ